MSKHDLKARPACHRKREPTGAHLSVVFAALAVTRFTENRTGWSIRKFVRTARRHRTVQIRAGQHVLTAEDPLPPGLRDALALIKQPQHLHARPATARATPAARPTPATACPRLAPIRENRQQTGLYGAPDERRDLQAGQIRYALDRDAGSFAQVDVLCPVLTHNIKQGDQPSVSFMVHGIGEEHRVIDNKAGFSPHFPEQRLFDALTVLDSTPETRPAARIRDSGLVVTVMHEQAAVSHDQQHRRPAL